MICVFFGAADGIALPSVQLTDSIGLRVILRV